VRLPRLGQLAQSLKFSNFDAIVCGGIAADETDPKNHWSPLRRLDKWTVGDEEPILRLLRSAGAVSPDVQHALSTAIQEGLQNVDDHAKSPIGALLCAQYVPDGRTVAVALVDFGRGIGPTLRAAHPEIQNDWHALTKVLEGGITALSVPNNLGLGLSNVQSVVTETVLGILTIISGAAIGAAVKNSTAVTRFDDPFTGTLISFTLPLELGASVICPA